MTLLPGILAEVQTTRWLGLEWSHITIIGLIGNAIWGTRFLIQWIESERKGESVIPVSFWYYSILGTIFMVLYFIFRRDPVGILGYLPNSVIYVRNIQLVRRKAARERAPGAAPSGPADAAGHPRERTGTR